MAKEYDNTDRGALFTNDRKATSKHPDYTGRINIKGTEYWLSGWLNTARNNKKYVSLRLGDEIIEKPAEAPDGFIDTPKVTDEDKEYPVPSDFDDDIPF